jgi:polygalacturonase
MRIFDIKDYGAVGDGKTDNSFAIQKAIDECSNAGGGIVNIPGDNIFMSGPFNLKSFVDLHLKRNSTILANPDESVYVKSAFKENFSEGSIWIGGENLEKVTISGHGVIDCNGIAFMGPEEKAAYVLKDFDKIDRRPHLLTAVNIKNLVIRDVTFMNSAYWCLHLVGCSDVLIDGIFILNNLKIRNSDGIDLDHTKNVIIKDCYIESGDDCICFKTRREYKEYGATENVNVSNCTMTSTSCSVKLGSENMDAIRNVTVKDCSIKSSNRGIGIQNRDEGVIENITFENIFVEGRLFDDVWWGKAEPIYVTAYKRKSSKDKDANLRFAEGQTEGRVGIVRNIKFKNINCKSENGVFVGGEIGKINDVQFNDVHVEIEKSTKYTGGYYDLRPSDKEGLFKAGTYGFYLTDADSVSIKNCSVKWGRNKEPYFSNALFAKNINSLQIEKFEGESAGKDLIPVQYESCNNVFIKR